MSKSWGEIRDEALRRCGQLPPQTNADRIRQMSDEELAELFSHLCCPYSLGGKVDCNAENKSCHQCWLDWLKSPAEEATHGN